MYYPCYVKATRPEYREFERYLHETAGRLNKDDAGRKATGIFLEKNFRKPWDENELRRNLHIISQETFGLTLWGQWILEGKTVLDVAPTLTEALLHSDCGDLTFGDLYPSDGNLKCFYVHFSGKPDIQFSNGAAFEGAYVAFDPVSIQITMCNIDPQSTNLSDRWKERYSLRLPREVYDLPAIEAVDRALAIDISDIQMAIEKDAKSENAALILMNYQRINHSSWKKAVLLTINLLAWIKSFPDDTRNYLDELPQRLANQLHDRSPKNRLRAISKLWASNYVVARRIGDEFSTRFDKERVVGAHWRRGHWRNQAHGPAHSLRKLIWIWPTFVSSNVD